MFIYRCWSILYLSWAGFSIYCSTSIITAITCIYILQRFRFCGGLDCPDWVLAEITILAKMVRRQLFLCYNIAMILQLSQIICISNKERCHGFRESFDYNLDIFTCCDTVSPVLALILLTWAAGSQCFVIPTGETAALSRSYIDKYSRCSFYDIQWQLHWVLSLLYILTSTAGALCTIYSDSCSGCCHCCIYTDRYAGCSL